MADIQNQKPEHVDRHIKVRQKKHSTTIDMTPMVDLAFLLLTFFILTTSFTKYKYIDLQMPEKSITNPRKISGEQALNIILLDSNRIRWYLGGEDKINTMRDADFSEHGSNSIRKIIQDKNGLVMTALKSIDDSIKAGSLTDTAKIRLRKESVMSNNKALFVLIKLDDKSKYQNLIKLLDQMILSNVSRYAVMNPSEEERHFCNKNL